ncbi:hypothetical protein M569_00903 [Genlisea aurea]|uniref:Protein HIRA n=1 Tax=Genlisea aurea TaxID=192259 RepID=S8D3B9_9LAMI|nr:hypothetical protein M569_00903 [Genlisea aurea]
MIAEKPTWIRHGGTQIFSIDIQPGGLRFATGGGDHKSVYTVHQVRIWNMKSVCRELIVDDSVPKLLATLRDHFGSVNCVRWARHGRYIASGSDDQVILIHERKPGSGTTEFGSGEPPDVENWKVAITLRGHTADVVDLDWSPDDSTLVSASLDNTIHVWDMSNGMCTAVLRGHSSLVKGVAWDPIGSFLASQSDDKTVIIWRTTDWSLAHRTEGHWTKSLGSTFFRRLDWSPCGHFITTTHGYQKPRHSAPVLERGEWTATFDFLGHNAPIIVAKFNHSMFRRSCSSGSQCFKSAATAGWSNGSLKNEAKDVHPYNVIAVGSQDRTITVWTTASPRPLFVAKHFFSQSVVDLTWSPDGYSLFACSLDGTVATFHFDGDEIGYKLTDGELDELKKNRYGDVRGRNGILAETPGQLLLEAAFAKQNLNKKVNAVVSEGPASSVKPSPKTNKTLLSDGKKTTISNGANKVGSSQIPSPVKQKEYIRSDGRKRIIPEAVGVTAHSKRTTLDTEPESLEFQNRLHHATQNDSSAVEGSVKRAAANAASSDPKERCGTTARASCSDNLVVEKVPSVGNEGANIIDPIGNLQPGGTLSIQVVDKKQGPDAIPILLEARLREHAVNDIVGTVTIQETEVCCSRGSQNLWSDRISGKVSVLAGNSNFWAVGCEDGSLQIYTRCGRRAMPTMMLGSSAVFIDCDEFWKLLLVTRKGSLYVWDLFRKKCLVNDSLLSLLNGDMDAKGTIKVISAKLSKSGSPLLVLATRHAYLFDMDLMCWLRVADDCFPASNFASSWGLSSAHGGELAHLQVDIRKYLARKPGWSRVTDDGIQTRAHLEAQLASALALDSPNEYCQCLLSYVRFLAREADQERLREVCESFLGPPVGIAAENEENKLLAWDPCVLGMNKHKLLRDDILPAMASNRKVQRLLNEFIDLLSEYELPGMKNPQTNVELESNDGNNKSIVIHQTTDAAATDAAVVNGCMDISTSIETNDVEMVNATTRNEEEEEEEEAMNVDRNLSKLEGGDTTEKVADKV